MSIYIMPLWWYNYDIRLKQKNKEKRGIKNEIRFKKNYEKSMGSSKKG